MTESTAPANHNFAQGRDLLISVAVWVAVYSALSLLTAVMTEDALGKLGGTPLLLLPLLAAVALLITSMWIAIRSVLCGWPLWAVLTAAGACVLVHQGIHHLMSPSPDRHLAMVVQFGIANVALIGMSSFIGKMIGSRVEQASWLIPIVLVLAAVDCWSAYFGPTKHVADQVQEAPESAEIAQQFLLWYPNLRPVEEEGMVVKPAIGIGDLIVAGIFFEVARRFALLLWPSVFAVCGGIFAALLLATKLGPVPALPFMGLAFLAVNWIRIPKNPKEVWACVIFIAILFVLLIFVINPVIATLSSG